jgi:hypothetical protein
MWKSFLFPTLSLIASLFVGVMRHASVAAWIMASATLVLSYGWTYYSVKTESDSQWLPMAVSVVAILILGLTTAS